MTGDELYADLRAAGDIYQADGVPGERAVEIATGHLRLYLTGRSARTPSEFARHFVAIRQAARS